jgi:hypothetical protein
MREPFSVLARCLVVVLAYGFYGSVIGRAVNTETSSIATAKQR